MKKARKVLAVVLALVLTATLSIAGTIAYLKDTDTATNVFTVGNVDIELKDVFEQNTKLYPNVDKNKDVWVKNVGTEDAYVRVHIAFPSMLDSGSEDEPEYASYNNTLHWNFAGASVVDGQWNWHSTDKNSDHATMKGWPGNGGDWNEYQATIDGKLYNVYVATYETVLKANEETATYALDNIYLDEKVTNEMVTEINNVLGVNWDIKVIAEAGQVAGFEGKPYDALNTQFGVPTTAKNPWNNYGNP